MIHNIFLKRVAHLIYEVHMHCLIVGVDLATTHIYGHEHGFDTAGGLCHQTGGACGGDGETGNIAATILADIVVELLVGFLDTQHEGVVGLTCSIEHLKGTTLLCHGHGRAIGCQCQCFVHLYGEVCGFLTAIAQT